jgi:selenide,water dikinase
VKQERACRRHIVLLGVGHTNAHIVRMWAMHPLPDTDLTCISDSNVATYSGFLPAVLAGQLPPEAMEIDLVRLCEAAGARLITEPVTGLDRHRQQLLFADRPAVRYDVLSVGIGSVPQMPPVGADSPSLVTIKPMRSFIDRLSIAVAQCDSGMNPLKIVVVGGGAAGVEVTQCLPARLKSMTTSDFHITLVNRGDELLPGCSPHTTRRVRRLLDQRGWTVLQNSSVIEIHQSSVKLQTGTAIPADVVIWATAATAPALLSEFDLPKDDRGFLLTNNALQSTSGDPIFAVGDTGTIEDGAVPKAGVYAVRQGPILWDNIRRQLNGQTLVPFEPQSSFLKLLNMGDGSAVGEWRGFSFEGHWAMRLKQRIDQQFMDKYQLLADQMTMPEDMQCRGCGCKLGGDTLEAALGGDGSTSRDDATIIRAGTNASGKDDVLVTTDFFSAPFRDAWLTGRIAAIHAASDIYAMGAFPFAAEAIVVLPEGDESTQMQILSDFQAGAAREFERMGANITGGHTITGPRWEVGFTVFGRSAGDRLIRKQGLVIGDHLFLTKPLGSGVLMAALMRGKCRHSDYQSMINVMLRNNHESAQIAVSCGVVTGTDVTGFGLLGHLQEMLTDDIRVMLDGKSIPYLPGACAAAQQGIASSLLPANRCYLSGVVSDRNESLDLLLDPQTCGGLLLAVPPQSVATFQRQFSELRLPEPSQIGEVYRAEPTQPRISVET